MSCCLGTREECDYTKCYCEENVYRLCERVPSSERSRFSAVFISNATRCIPLFAQRAAGERPFVVWDYHVVMLEEAEESSNLIWDLDTLLPFPCTFDDYWKAAVQPRDWNIPEEYSRYFRVIPCEKYLEHFSSDRSHMKTEDGAWLSPAPSWEPILKDGLNNLDDFISMDSKILTDISAVFDENEMRRRYGGEQLISQS